MTKIYIWPDGTWCAENEFDDVLDTIEEYRIVEVSSDWDLGTIKEFVDKLDRELL